jgi:hypothetical protein
VSGRERGWQNISKSGTSLGSMRPFMKKLVPWVGRSGAAGGDLIGAVREGG